MKIEFLCANRLHFKEQIKIIKTYTKIKLKIENKNIKANPNFL